MTSMLGDILTNSGYFVPKDESSYQDIILALLHGMLGGYTVTREPEAGNGRADLVLKPDFPGGVPVIMELRDERSGCDLEESAEDAVAQIHRRRYCLGFRGKVVIVGLAFHGKTPCARTEMLDLRPPFRPAF